MMRTRLGLALLLPLLACAPVAGADTVIADKSEIAFTMKQMGVNFDGRFRKWKADVVFRPQALPQSKAVIDIDLASVDLASEDSETEARGPAWFDTRRFPVARFTSTAIRDLGGGRYEVAGKLSLKGIERNYAVPIRVTTDPAGNRIADGTVTLRRLDYKVGEGEWADTATVANDVAVRVHIVLAPAG
jgi:polyisoprenoid-binding protein YceI